jgi:hypothetical protein
MGAVSLNRPAMIDRRIIGNPPHGPEVTGIPFFVRAFERAV